MKSALSYIAVAILAGAATYGAAQVQQDRHRLDENAKDQALSVEAPPEEVIPQAAEKPPALVDVSPEEDTNIQVYRSANRSVVNISTRSVQMDDFFMLSSPRAGSGSGSVLDKQGHILTNFHVVEDARQIQVSLFDGTSHSAELIGSDPNNDVAVLKIDAPAEKLFPLSWGDSAKLLVGMRVFAIGNPYGLERTLTTGIVSSLNRSLPTENNRIIRGIIQTDAAINPGNSGGPLLNRRAELVGITTAIVSRSGGNSGVGLAIPANTARRIVNDLIRFGKVIRPDAGILRVYELDRGLLIAQLAQDGPAQQAGLRGPQLVVVRRGGYEYRGVDRSKADLIVAVDSKPVKTTDDLLSYVESKKVGEQVIFTVVREGKKLDVPVKLEKSSN